MPVDTCLCKGGDADCPLCFGRGMFRYADEDQAAGGSSGAEWLDEDSVGEIVGCTFEVILEIIGELLSEL